jgi:hypothetical protein
MKSGNKIFFVLCALTIIVGFIIYLEASIYQKKSKITDGTVINTGISSYEIHYSSDDGVKRVYKGNHGSSKGWHYHDGDIVKVFYKADNPDKMRYSDGVRFGRKVVIIGIIMLLSNLLLVYSNRKRTKLENNFKTTGRKLEARILKMDIDTTITVLRKNSFYVDCSWTDPTTGREYAHTIRNIWKDPRMLLAGRNSIDVYIDTNDPDKYFLDISFLGAAAK